MPPGVVLPMPATNAALRWSVAALLVVAAIAVYWNSLDYGFVNWDDRPYVRDNPLVVGNGGISAIWLDAFQEKPAKQYYPLVWTSFWIERRFFGESIRALRVTQIALHAGTAVALYFALLWLGAPLFAASAAALLFVVHPVNVASVTWIAERKNTLSGLFFWLSLLLYVQHRRRGGAANARYLASIAAYLTALFAKTACVVLAPVILVTDRILDGRWTRRAIVRALPYFAIGLVMGRVTAHVEAMHRKSGEALDVALRPLVAAASIVHYACKTLFPLELVPIYPRWSETFGHPRYWISMAILVAAAIFAWRMRRRIVPLVSWSIALFLLTLAPVLGFVQFNLLQFTFVSDHFLYIACVGLLLPVGLLINSQSSVTVLHRLLRRPSLPSPAVDEHSRGRLCSTSANGDSRHVLSVPRHVPVVILGILAVTLGALTIRQNRVWENPVTFWEFTIAHHPGCFPAHLNLGNYYYRLHDHGRALPYYQAASKLDPDMILTERNAARCLRRLHRPEEALEAYRRAVANEARKSSYSVSARVEYANYLRTLGRSAEALAEYDQALKRQPDHDAARRAAEELRRGGSPH